MSKFENLKQDSKKAQLIIPRYLLENIKMLFMRIRHWRPQGRNLKNWW